METITVTNRHGVKRQFERAEWDRALTEAKQAFRGNSQSLEDKAVELLCTNRALRADREARLAAIKEPTPVDILSEAFEKSLQAYIAEWLEENSRYSDTLERAMSGRIMSAGMMREYNEARKAAEERIQREGLIPFTAKDTEAGQEAIYLSMMLGVPVPAWCK